MKFFAVAFLVVGWTGLWLPAAQAASPCGELLPACHPVDEFAANAVSTTIRTANPEAVIQTRTYALGVHKFRFSRKDAVTGWQLSDRWYFGQQRGAVKNFGFVRKHRRMLISVGREGVGFSMQF